MGFLPAGATAAGAATTPESDETFDMLLSDSPDKPRQRSSTPRPRSSSTTSKARLASIKPPRMATKPAARPGRAATTGPSRRSPQAAARQASPAIPSIPAMHHAMVLPDEPGYEGRLQALEQQQAEAHNFMTQLATATRGLARNVEHLRSREHELFQEVDDVRHVMFDIQKDLHSSKSRLETTIANIETRIGETKSQETTVAARIASIELILENIHGVSQKVDGKVTQMEAAKPQDGAFIADRLQAQAQELISVRQMVQRLELQGPSGQAAIVGAVPSAMLTAADDVAPYAYLIGRSRASPGPRTELTWSPA